jgi:DNA-binding NarL/FixJ family response regulator
MAILTGRGFGEGSSGNTEDEIVIAITVERARMIEPECSRPGGIRDESTLLEMKVFNLERRPARRRAAVGGGGAIEQRHMVLLEEKEPSVGSTSESSGSEFVLALAIDSEGRLVYMSPAFAELVGVDRSEYIGERRPFPWCVPDETEQCRNRSLFLSSRQARDLGISAVSWKVSDAVGKCLRVPKDRGALLEGECEISQARCAAIADSAEQESGKEHPSQDLTPMEELAANLRRIALELEKRRMSAGPQSLHLSPDMHPQLRTLSSREWEILRSIMKGRRVKPIAQTLCISPHTVRSHLQSIFQKVGVHSQAELIEKLCCGPSVGAPGR